MSIEAEIKKDANNIFEFFNIVASFDDRKRVNKTDHSSSIPDTQ
jgi:hypothetical protein